MKNKTKNIIITTLLSSLVISSFTIFSLAKDKEKNESHAILTEEKLSNSSNTYEKISNKDTYNEDLLMQKINNYKNSMNSISSIKKLKRISNKEEDYTIEFFNNEKNSTVESVINFKDELYCLNAENGNLIHYVQKNPSLVSTKLNEEEIKQIGLELYNSIKDTLNGEYIYTELENYDDEIWTIRFYKYYNNLINYGEAVKISFSPESKEIVSLVILDNPFANNTVEISEETAFNIAKKYMKKTKATDMTSEIKIVTPNYFWYSDISDYKNIQTSRLAYVFTCNNDANAEIYVDCTTGEVIGGNMTVGGEM